MYRILWFLLFIISWDKVFAAADTIKVYFAINKPQLDTKAQQTIDSAVYHNIIQSGMKLGIIGYADYLGGDSTNIILSENRAKNVQSYLIGLGMKTEDIEMVIGRGEVKRAIENGNAGYIQDRRVDIIPGGFKEKPRKKDTVVVEKTKPTAAIIDLTKVKENETIRLENLLFLPGRHALRDGSTVELLKLHKIMVDHPTLKISIEGHICCTDATDGYDYDTEENKLSENRARAVYEYLIYKGIGKERMTYKGFGHTRLLADPEVTEEDQNMNRRVEIRVLSK